MKKNLTIGLLFLSCLCFAQNNDTLTLKDLDIPNSPGFILLDQAPTSIERPNTSRAFALSAINSFGESTGFPKNYAVEFTPFWFLKLPRMSVLKYAGYSNNKLQPFSSLKMVSLSMAYVNRTDSTTNKPINNVAFGARTTLLKIYSKNHKKNVYDANQIAIDKLKKIDLLLNREGATPQLRIENLTKYAEIEKRVLESISKNDSLSPITEVLKVKPLFALDAAIAYNMFFTNNDFYTNRFGRFGAWVTLNYSQSLNKDNSNYLNFYAVGRYLSDGTIKNNQDKYEIQEFLDFGGKIELEFKKLSWGFEYIFRANEKSKTYRSTGLLKYKISDSIYLTGAFGKNFGNANNLVSLLGINWGIGTTGNEKVKIE
jgi:hypothetical protein